jgi:enterochelin esterase family protein
LPPTIIVCPDLYTYFGGSQYIDSDYLGFHGSFIVKELIPYIEANFPVLTGSAHRGVFGRSSGGYGALRLSMDFPGVFSAVACHSGDLGFDTAMRRDLIDLCKVLERFDGDSLAFLKYCQEAKKLSGQEVHALMLHGMGATYSPNPHSQLGFDLPINLYTGEILDDIWQKWCDHDPVVGIDRQEAQRGLKALKYLYLDCGKRDQFNLLYGARQFSAKLTDLAIEHDYQEFNDNHSGTAYRYDISLPPMLRALVKK